MMMGKQEGFFVSYKIFYYFIRSILYDEEILYTYNK